MCQVSSNEKWKSNKVEPSPCLPLPCLRCEGRRAELKISLHTPPPSGPAAGHRPALSAWTVDSWYHPEALTDFGRVFIYYILMISLCYITLYFIKMMNSGSPQTETIPFFFMLLQGGIASSKIRGKVQIFQLDWSVRASRIMRNPSERGCSHSPRHSSICAPGYSVIFYLYVTVSTYCQGNGTINSMSEHV
jgi:hypothetical protein